MNVAYMTSIHAKVNQLMRENNNLLNKMNEGLLVVSEKYDKLQFANQPAKLILKKCPK